MFYDLNEVENPYEREGITQPKFEIMVPQGYVSCIQPVLKSQSLLYLATNLGYIYKINMSCIDFELTETFSLVYP